MLSVSVLVIFSTEEEKGEGEGEGEGGKVRWRGMRREVEGGTSGSVLITFLCLSSTTESPVEQDVTQANKSPLTDICSSHIYIGSRQQQEGVYTKASCSI